MSQHDPAPERHLKKLESARHIAASVQRNIGWMRSEYPDDDILFNSVNALIGELDDVLSRLDNVMMGVRNIDTHLNPSEEHEP